MSFRSIAELYAENSGYKNRIFRFTLQNPTEGELVLIHVPDGWKKGELTFERSEKYNGVFYEYSTNTLIFPKEGKDYLETVFETQGVKAECTILIEYFVKSTLSYAEIFTGRIDFGTYRLLERGVRIQVIDDSFTESVRTRDDTLLDLLNTKTVDGASITPFPGVENLTIDLPEYHIKNKAVWDKSDLNEFLGTSYLIPIKVVTSNIDWAVSPRVGTFLSSDNAFIKEITVDSYRLRYDIDGKMTLNGGSPPYELYLKLRRIKADGSFTDVDIDDISVVGTSFFWEFKGEIDISVTNAPEDHILYIFTNGVVIVAGTFNADVRYDTILPQIETRAFPIYEAFLRALQKITGDANPLYSAKFGRTDSELTSYASDGENIAITTGTNIRDANAGNIDSKINTTLAELYSAMESKFPLSLNIEKIAGVNKVRIEDFDYAYDPAVVLDISSRIRELSVEVEVIPGKHYNEVHVGFATSESDKEEGLYEFNKRSSWSIPLDNFKNVLKLVSQIRGDTIGMIKLRDILPDDTQDIKEDNSSYMIDLYRNGYLDFKARTTEDIIVTGNPEFEPSETYNLRLTPSRSVLRHLRNINSVLIRNSGSFIPKMTNEGADDFSTDVPTDTVSLSERELYGNNPILWYYEIPIFYPEKFIVEEFEFFYDDIIALRANPRGLIKLSDTKYGWILSLTTNLREKKASGEFLRCNLDAITPVTVLYLSDWSVGLDSWFIFSGAPTLSVSGARLTVSAIGTIEHEFDTILTTGQSYNLTIKGISGYMVLVKIGNDSIIALAHNFATDGDYEVSFTWNPSVPNDGIRISDSTAIVLSEIKITKDV